MAVRVIQVGRAERAEWGPRLAALERMATYPIGDDTFQLDHGADYFAFFDAMGDVLTFAAVEGERVAAVGSGILRRVPFRQGGPLKRTWYVCDLKVHPDFRRQRIPLQILRAGFCPNYLRCMRGYGISMNPGDGSPNRVVRLVKHWRWSPVRLVGTLLLWSLDAEAMRDVAPLLEEHRGPLSYLSHSGVKDVVLGSTGQPMPLLHVQFGAAPAGQHAAPQPGHVHMFCVLEGDPLCEALQARGIPHDATASLLAHGMRRCDWRFVLTSEI